MAALLSEREGPDPCLDWLLLLFWVHYTEDGPHLPFTGNKGKNVANDFKEKEFANARGKVVELVTLHTWEI